ncbi:MAG: pseudouridine synthase [Bdellovibrionales bacterium]|nr:pseudouridine synthase [Bdellovibrionales bacterium]
MERKTLRLNHFLSSCGLCSRRKADDILKSKKVTVNNKRVKDPSMKVDPEGDQVKLDGKLIYPPQQKYYIAFNKPKKVITSMSDPKGRPCIADYFKKAKDRIFPIGRLDWHSEGLILLTNDGDFSRKVLQKKIPKTYLVKLDGRPTTAQLLKLKKGVYTEVGRLKAVYIKELRKKMSQHSWVKVILTEGRNRQLHRMFEKIGFQIKILKRTSIGKLKLKSLKPGEYFFLSSLDIKKVFSLPSEMQSKKSRKIPERAK